MKKSLLLGLLAAGLFSVATGCATPGYTSQERGAMILRNMGFEYEQIQDDVDDIFLLRPAGHLTPWNIQ